MIRRTVRRRKAGFTLAELLVALVVICLLSTCVFLITRSAGNTFTRGEDVISANDLKSIALEYVRQELRTASTIMLTDDLEADGGELIKSGALLFSHGGRLYTADANVDGALAASVFHKKMIAIAELKDWLSREGIEMRTLFEGESDVDGKRLDEIGF